jgi:hypothetical protein
MTPCTNHRYFLPSHGLAFEASWRRPARRRNGWIRDRVEALFFGGPTPGTPEGSVNPEALLAAVDLIERQDIDGATSAFTRLGYDVRVRALGAQLNEKIGGAF